MVEMEARSKLDRKEQGRGRSDSAKKGVVGDCGVVGRASGIGEGN